VQLSDDEWKQKLTPEQYHILREKGTEAPGTGKYVDMDADGMYSCAACGAALFSSDTKFESTLPGLVGWPAFSDMVDNDAVVLKPDGMLGMQRTEVTCANCGSHLGHLFENDPSSPSGDHFCINSAALDFKEKN
jgi:peptide-methionine (R)-S-oxide reductase